MKKTLLEYQSTFIHIQGGAKNGAIINDSSISIKFTK